MIGALRFKWLCPGLLFQEKPYSVPNIPPYNPLDKFGNVKGLDREGIKKYPYNRDDTITTQGKCFIALIIELFPY